MARAGRDAPSIADCYPVRDGGSPAQYRVSTVVAGDFNTWSNRETALHQLFVDFPDSPPPLGTATRGSFTTDHLLFRRNSAGNARILFPTHRRIDNRYHSDHHAIVAWFAFGK